jgi:hypothetical protein
LTPIESPDSIDAAQWLNDRATNLQQTALLPCPDDT